MRLRMKDSRSNDSKVVGDFPTAGRSDRANVGHLNRAFKMPFKRLYILRLAEYRYGRSDSRFSFARLGCLR